MQTAPRTGVDRRAMAALAGGHVLADTCQGAVPALLPFLIASRHFSFAAASSLVLAATVSSSVIQPLFGHYSDRHSLPWLMPLGVSVAAIGIGLAGLMPTYGLTFAAIVVSGIGVAAFHPEGSRFANYVSGSRRATGMSFFSVGGNAGFALGPLLVTPLILAFGLSGTLVLLLPAGVMAAVLWHELPRLSSFRPAPGARASHTAARADRWDLFARLAGVIACRSFIYFGLLTFLPLYYVNVLHTSKAQGNLSLALMLVGGAFGTLAGGPLADRFGRRTVLLGSMLAVLPLTLAFLASGRTLATVLAFLIGAATVSTFSVTVVMGQEFLPSRLGVASGVTLGLSIGLGGLGAPLLGLVADHYGVGRALEIVAVLPVLAIALVLMLPGRGRVPALRTAAPRAQAGAE